MAKIQLIPHTEFERAEQCTCPVYEKMALIADMCRFNTLAAVKRAGSGHLGSSLSAMDLVVWLYYQELNVRKVGCSSPARDIYFSSKGHDAPGLYAVFHALGLLPEEKLLALRRLGGLDGHPHVSTPGIEANTGSLGMGISKAKGMVFGKRLQRLEGRVFVLTGDGEFQEGQIYEALQSAVHQRVRGLTVIMDHNKVQSDKPVAEILNLGDIEAKVRAFGWHVTRCSGHDFRQIERALAESAAVDGPAMIIADTIKGCGVSFMEHPAALKENNGIYRWHSGAPADEPFARASDEIRSRIEERLQRLGALPLELKDVTPQVKPSGVSDEFVAEAYGKALVELAASRSDLVVLDADLAADCRVRAFEQAYPERFIECGIAEQDMVSTAGGLARQGLLPVVNSFAAFLASRANEQIYTNAGEGTKIIYACHYAGLIPAGPGLSHQSLRDISLVTSLPNCIVIQPANAEETRQAVQYCVQQATDNCVLRLVIGPSPRRIVLPEGYRLTPGHGTDLTVGGDAVLLAYGPVMLNEALVAAELLAKESIALRVINMPWLNRFAPAWLEKVFSANKPVFVLEDHSVTGGLGQNIAGALSQKGCTFSLSGIFGVETYPAWGRPDEVLKEHRLDGESVAKRITGIVKE